MGTAGQVGEAAETGRRSKEIKPGEKRRAVGYVGIILLLLATFVANLFWFYSGTPTSSRVLGFGFNMLTSVTSMLVILRLIDGRERIKGMIKEMCREDERYFGFVDAGSVLEEALFIIVFAVIVMVLELLAFQEPRDSGLFEQLIGQLTSLLLGAGIGAWVGYFWSSLASIVTFFRQNRDILIKKSDRVYPSGRGEVFLLARTTTNFVVNNSILLSVPIILGLLYSVLVNSMLVFAGFFFGNLLVWSAVFFQYLQIRNVYADVTGAAQRQTLDRLAGRIAAKYEKILDTDADTTAMLDEFNRLNQLYDKMVAASEVPIEQIGRVKLVVAFVATTTPIILNLLKYLFSGK